MTETASFLYIYIFMEQKNGAATASTILGIVSLVIAVIGGITFGVIGAAIALILGIVAVVLGINAKKHH